VGAALTDRDAGEADRVLAELIGKCQAARRLARPGDPRTALI
jgi:hypothetical protein